MRLIGIVAWVALVNVLSAATLSNPRRVGSEFEFTIIGASNAIYAVDASTNLQNWTTVMTNRQVGEVRIISMPASADAEFYRVRPLRPLFTGAFGARESIRFAGGGVRVDSFDSADPLVTTDGRYDPAKARDRGDITASSVLTNSLNIGNAKVHGVLHVATGGGVVFGPGASVGSSEWVNSSQFGIEPGHLVEGPGRVFVDAEVPTGHIYVTPERGTIDGTNYTCVLSNGYYALPEFRGSLVVTGRATLYVSGSAQLQNIVIRPDASLDLYVGGGLTAISRADNRNFNPATFAYYGLPGNTNVSLSGSGSFLGTIYAPAANVSLMGGGNDFLDFIGAIIGRHIDTKGSMNMHYDERLGVAGPAW